MYEASNSVTAFTELLASAFGVMTEAGITQRVLPTAVQLGAASGGGHHEPHGDRWAVSGSGHWWLQFHHSVPVAGK